MQRRFKGIFDNNGLSNLYNKFNQAGFEILSEKNELNETVYSLKTNGNELYKKMGSFRNMFFILTATQNNPGRANLAFDNGERITKFQNKLTDTLNRFKEVNAFTLTSGNNPTKVAITPNSAIIRNALNIPNDADAYSNFSLNQNETNDINNYIESYNSFKKTLENSQISVIQLLKDKIFGETFRKNNDNINLFKQIIGENGETGLGKIYNNLDLSKKIKIYAEKKLVQLKTYLNKYLENADYITNQSEKTTILSSINNLKITDDFYGENRNSGKYKEIKDLIDQKNKKGLNEYIKSKYNEAKKFIGTNYQQRVNALNNQTSLENSYALLKEIINSYIDFLAKNDQRNNKKPYIADDQKMNLKNTINTINPKTKQE
ncbi:UNVERIFIED_CONTAM: hypothetical protein O8I53_11570 [Campylobacter lari]